jgi:hypothetical protein
MLVWRCRGWHWLITVPLSSLGATIGVVVVPCRLESCLLVAALPPRRARTRGLCAPRSACARCPAFGVRQVPRVRRAPGAPRSETWNNASFFLLWDANLPARVGSDPIFHLDDRARVRKMEKGLLVPLESLIGWPRPRIRAAKSTVTTPTIPANSNSPSATLSQRQKAVEQPRHTHLGRRNPICCVALPRHSYGYDSSGRLHLEPRRSQLVAPWIFNSLQS